MFGHTSYSETPYATLGVDPNTEIVPTGASATGLTGMRKGGMTKKGYAKGGMMKKKGYSKGGAMPMGKDPKTGKMIPKFAMDGKGKMARGGMMKKKGMARGGAMMKKKGMARGGATRRGR